MKLRSPWLFTGFILLAGLVFVLGGNASAATNQKQPGFNVITSPLPIKLNASPGQTITTQLRVSNQGTQPEGIKVGLMKFGASGDTGTPDLYDLTPKDTFASWVKFSPEQFVAQPNVWNSITMTITIPKSAGLGYYLAVTFSPSHTGEVSGAANLNGVVATLVLLNVQVPNEKPAIQLVNFQTDHGLYEYLPVNFSIKLHNNGNIFIAPVGNIFIKKGSKSVATLDFNDAGGNVLPGSNRVFSVPWSDGFPVFTQKLVNDKPIETKNGFKQTLKWNFSQASKFRFGRYTATLLVVYDNGQADVPQEATVSFWVLPWKLMTIALLILLAVLYGIFSLVRSLVRKTRSGTDKFSSHVKKK